MIAMTNVKKNKILALLFLSSTLILSACGDVGGGDGKRGTTSGKPVIIGEKPGTGEDPSEVDDGDMEEVPEQPTTQYTRFAHCTGWPVEGGIGVVTLFWNSSDAADRFALVQIDDRTQSSMITQSYAFMKRSKKDNSVLLIQRAIQGVSDGFQFTIKEGSQIKTPLYSNGKTKVADLLCNYKN